MRFDTLHDSYYICICTDSISRRTYKTRVLIIGVNYAKFTMYVQKIKNDNK